MSHLNLITEEEERQFHEQGYLLLRSAIPVREVDSLLAEVQRLVDDSGRNGGALHEPYYHSGSYKLTRILRLSHAFDYLVDHPAYFGRLVSLIGTHIQLMDSEIFVRGSAEQAITGFHTDLGPGMQKLIHRDGSAFFEIKMQLFLTDLSQPDSSNFTLFPGSHRRSAPDANELCMIESINRTFGAHGELPPGAIQVLAAPGDALLFPHTLWHSVAPNRSGRTRYSISLRYGQLALRPLERFDPVLTDETRRLSSRQRRLLGDFGEEGASAYRPRNQEAIICGSC